jgi:hypothetical protein
VFTGLVEWMGVEAPELGWEVNTNGRERVRPDRNDGRLDPGGVGYAKKESQSVLAWYNEDLQRTLLYKRFTSFPNSLLPIFLTERMCTLTENR